MLAANPHPNDSLSLLLLILGLIGESRQSEIPEPLRSRVFEMLRDGARIAKDALITAGKSTTPEALELAVELRAEEALSAELATLTDFSGIRPDLAHRLLERLGDHSAFAK